MSRSLATRLLVVPAALLSLTVGLVGAAGSGSAAGSAAQASRRGDPGDFRIYRLSGGDGPRVGWANCRRINYRVNYDHAPKRSRWHVQEAVRRLRHATGLRYHYGGRTQVRPTPSGRNYPRGVKVVIGWAGPRSKHLARRQVGVGGWAARNDGSIASGFVIINYRIKMAPGFGKGPRTGVQGTRGQVLMHELAHTVGLAHVRAKAQIMFPKATRKPATWGAGDWHGLRKQGRRAGCL
ncbi:MAG TPA: hypothetical protein VKB55_11580 [Nocardioidaceae bacterium]|nr:hypothetical protein [Nocardioidaceae bacterium]